MNDCQKIMSEENAALVKQRLGLSDPEYAEFKGQDGDANTLSSSDIVIVVEKARAGNQPAAVFLEKFKSKAWYRYKFDERMTPANLLCTTNLARSKGLPSVSQTKMQELNIFASAHHLVEVDLKLESPDTAEIFWQSLISYCVAGEAGFDKMTKEIEEEKKRLATVDGLADVLVNGCVEPVGKWHFLSSIKKLSTEKSSPFDKKVVFLPCDQRQ